MKQLAIGAIVAVAALAIAACQPSTSKQAEELAEQNKKILAKL